MSIIQMSLQASAIIAMAVVIRALGMGKLPKWSFQLLWGIALVRLMLPLRVESPMSVYGAARQVERAWPQMHQVWPRAERTFAAMTAPAMTAPAIPQSGAAISAVAASPSGEALPPVLTSALSHGAPVSPLLLLWLAGAALLLGYFLFTHFRCRRVYHGARTLSRLRVSQRPFSRPLSVNASCRVQAPLTYGVLRPVILLPERLLSQSDELEQTEDVRYIIAHELAHVRHWDVLKRWLLTACLCVHWFNPLVWAMVVLAGRDMELSSDEAVLRKYGEGEKARYASLLLDMEAARIHLAPLASHFSKVAIEERIVMIMKHKKASLLGIVLALALVLCTAVALGTDAAPAGGAAPSSPTEAEVHRLFGIPFTATIDEYTALVKEKTGFQLQKNKAGDIVELTKADGLDMEMYGHPATSIYGSFAPDGGPLDAAGIRWDIDLYASAEDAANCFADILYSVEQEYGPAESVTLEIDEIAIPNSSTFHTLTRNGKRIDTEALLNAQENMDGFYYIVDAHIGNIEVLFELCSHWRRVDITFDSEAELARAGEIPAQETD
jgi:beta-lactamase regulating signal transducer with metallopeptidase domain